MTLEEIKRLAAVRRRGVSAEQRFWAKVNRETDNGCWLWTKATSRTGYGMTRFGSPSQTMHAHRLAWLLTNGPIPDGQCVLHRCDNPPCVRPTHLFLGTQLENIADRHSKGRTRAPRGEEQGAAKLTAAQVERIRHLRRTTAMTQKEVGALFGIAQAHVSAIELGKSWSHVGVNHA